MNYKLLFPTYRNRYLFVRDYLEKICAQRKVVKALNLGTGEGDYDAMIAPYCQELVACDINEQDIDFAKALNQDIDNLTYQVEDALQLSFADNTFDLVVSVDVLEHVGEPERMIAEVSRVLKPNGMALITFPSNKFPITYDPVNRILSNYTDKRISQGAYAFGHWYLISSNDFRVWAQKNGLQVVEEQKLSGYVIGLLEMYWTGLIQKVFKENASNQSNKKEKKVALRPTTAEPVLTKVTDGIIKADRWLSRKSKYAVGRGMVVQKMDPKNTVA